MSIQPDLVIRCRARCLLLVLACLGLSACNVWDRLLGNYTGPLPARADLTEEQVIVRQLLRDASGIRGGQVTSVYVDRVSYLSSGRLKSVDRVILGQTFTLGPRIDSLAVVVGDTVVVSTEYANVHRGGTAPGIVPDWPGTGHHDYPVGWHIVTQIRRKSE
jgi:hypothetical protein